MTRLLALLLLLAACTSGSSNTPTSGSSNTPTSGSSNTPRSPSSSSTLTGPPHVAWRAPVDGAVYGRPIVVGGSVIAATENDSVYALSLATGAVQWRVHLGTPVPLSDLPCGDIDPLGITGAPAYAAGSVFVVTETGGGAHTLVALSASDGTVRWSRPLDVGGHNRLAEQQRGALAVANGRVYVPFGGLFGDCGDYVGYVAGVATDGSGSVLHFDVPTAREGGIWAPSGPAVAADGSLYVSVGNGASTSAPYDMSDSVLRLRADLALTDFFAPSAWASENATDEDLGSTGPLLLGSFVVVGAKDGRVYLLDASHLGGIGGQLSAVSGCTAFGGMAAEGNAVFAPCAEGLRRIDVVGRTLVPRWRAAPTGTPAVADGVVWSLETGAGVLHALDEATGADVAQVAVGAVTRFAAPTVTGSIVLVGTTTSVVAVSA